MYLIAIGCAPPLRRVARSAHRLDLKDIRVISKPGGTIDDSEMVDGVVFDQKAAKAAGGPIRMDKAKVRCVRECRKRCGKRFGRWVMVRKRQRRLGGCSNWTRPGCTGA